MAALCACLCLTGTTYGDDAKVTITSIPSTLGPGERAEVKVDLLNTGDEDWQPDTLVRIAAIKDPRGNDVDRNHETPFSAECKLGGILAPWDTASKYGVKTLTIEGPPQRGTWTVEVWVQVGSTRLKEGATAEVNVVQDYYGRLTTLRVPTVPTRGQVVKWQIIALNSGKVAWDGADISVRCRVKRTISGHQSDGKKAFEQHYEFADPLDLVYPDDTCTFEGKFTAPPEPGKWELEWQLYDRPKKRYFGQKGTITIEIK